MDLFVLRHGEAGKTIPSGGSDSKRPLTVAGEKEMIVISKALRKMGVRFDVILMSPLKRARQSKTIKGELWKQEESQSFKSLGLDLNQRSLPYQDNAVPN
jgi:phosphohistidine phosphatase SixA